MYTNKNKRDRRDKRVNEKPKVSSRMGEVNASPFSFKQLPNLIDK